MAGLFVLMFLPLCSKLEYQSKLRSEGEGSKVAPNKAQEHHSQEATLLVFPDEGVSLGEFDVVLHDIVFVDHLVLP